MVKSAQKVIIGVLFFCLLISYFVLNTKYAMAATAIPNPGRIPCPTNSSDPEFSSDRPYQASPCGSRPITYWCGNGVVIDLGGVSTSYCGADTCPTDIHKDQRVVVDLTNVQLPILGNTQLTANSANGADQIDDATKTNDYVSWYLGGTNNKAETNTNNLDTAGPLQKLLPGAIQDAQRIQTISSALSTSSDYTDDETGKTVSKEAENHNQIVVCGKSNLGVIGDFFHIGTITPTACYDGNGTAANGQTFRLINEGGSDSWEGDLSYWNNIANGVIQQITTLLPNLPVQAIRDSIGNHWNKKVPPLPWDNDPYSGLPMTEVEYQKYYNEWRGKTCVLIPVINHLVCVDNFLVPNKYADLYPYVPLANTIDKKGAQAVTNVHISAPRAEISIPIENGAEHGYDIIHSPQLFISHSKESADLSALLQSTFKPQVKAGSKEPLTTIPGDVENPATCQIISSRTNSGDDATFDTPKSFIDVIVHYDVTSIDCHDPRTVCDRDPDTHACLSTTHTIANCSSEVYASIGSISKTPYADEIWDNTVAGSQSIFRRIYPKTGANAPVTCIADSPASSNATYTVSGGTSNDVSGIQRIIEPDSSSVGGGGSADSVDAQLYYPHFGGVLTYFLNGIQTALRPQGLGNPSPESGTLCDNIAKTTCDGKLFASLQPPGSTTDTAHSYFESQIKSALTPALISIYATAEQKTGVPCEILAGVHFEEGDNKPNASLQNGGPLSGSLLASAIQAGNEIKAKVGGKITTWNQAITALSRYNGGGNSNCGVVPGYTGPCPPPEGIDDLYPMAWIDPRHLNMFLIYCSDFTKCSPFPKVTRPGVLTVATELYNTEAK